MTAAKVWDGSQWIKVNATGPQGAVGPQGVGALPTGPAGGALTGNYPDPGVNRAASGGLMAVQRLSGTNAGYRQLTGTPEDVYIAATGLFRLEVNYTPTVPCWWEVTANVGIVRKIDAAYHYCYVLLALTPADADGQSVRGAIETQHSGVQTMVYRSVSQWWKLNAGISYTSYCYMVYSGGTWQYYQDTNRLWITGRVFAQ